MTVAELMGHIARRGGHLEVADDCGLDFVGPADLLTDELRNEIRTRKDEIVCWLRTPFADHPVVDQLALDYERTLPDWLIERIHETWGRDAAAGCTR